MTTAAATSSPTTATSSSTDDSPTIHENNGASSNRTTFDTSSQRNEQQQCNLQQTQLENTPQSQQDESKGSSNLLADNKQQDQPSQHSPGASATETPTNASATISPTASSSSSSTSSFSSASSVPPSALQTTKESTTDVKDNQSPTLQNQSNTISTGSNTEQKRPMNAFLLFCKRQRSLVREKHPNLENRGITKILGDWWTNLDKEQKSKYTDMARQHKEAFMKANPDFKWCKTPNVSNVNNNNSNSTTVGDDNCINNQNNEQKHQQNHRTQQSLHPQHRPHPQNNFLYHHNLQQNNHHMATATNVELLTLQSVHNHGDLMHHSTNSIDMSVTNRQLEAPKPPKKRFLERNDLIHTNKDINSSASRHDTSLHGADIVPCISLDQDTLDRVIDKAFSEDSNSSSKPSGMNNSCKFSNRDTTNLTLSLGSSSNNLISFPTVTTAATTSTSSSSSSYPMSVDEPVDFSMNRTINTTRQQIINNLVEKMLSEPSDDTTGNVSKLNGTESSLKSYAGPPIKKDKPDA